MFMSAKHRRTHTHTPPLYLSLFLLLSLSYIITRVAPHCVNTLRILHAAYDATNTTSFYLSPFITRVAPHRSLSLSLTTFPKERV